MREFISIPHLSEEWRQDNKGLLKLVGSDIGIISDIKELLMPHYCSNLYNINSMSCDIGFLFDRSSQVVSGGSLHFTRELAFGASLGEIVERYCGLYDDDRSILGKKSEFQDSVSPDEFILFTDEQYKQDSSIFHRYSPDDKLKWIKGFNLLTEKYVYLPAQMVYLNCSLESEKRYVYTTSSGMAAGSKRNEAMWGALSEIIERDAFMLAWYNKISCPLILWEQDRGALMVYNKYFKRKDTVYYCVNLTTETFLPTVAVFMVNRFDGPPALVVGASSGKTLRIAWEKAMREAYQTFLWAQQMEASGIPYPKDFNSINTLEDHVRFYSNPENVHYASFMFSGLATCDLKSERDIIVNDIDVCLREVCRVFKEERGDNIYFVDITKSDVEEMGLYVYKALSPTFQPLDVSYSWRFLNNKRLKSPYNAPHPFP